jgi:signal transduction histidine kinase
MRRPPGIENMAADPKHRIESPQRLEALKRTRLMDSAPEEAFDRLTRLASMVINAPMAMVSLVGETKQFFKSATGLDVRETPLSHSFCKHVVDAGKPLVVQDANQHHLLSDNPAIQELNAVSYAGFPLLNSSGFTLGAFCVMDSVPREWSNAELQILKDLTSVVMSEIELREAYRHTLELADQLKEEHRLRKDLSEMIVHDLRTPVSSAISAIDTALAHPDLHEEMLQLASVSSYRTLELINDLLAASRMEAGRFPIKRSRVRVKELMRTATEQVLPLANLKSLKIIEKCEVPQLVADRQLLERILVNLLSNAVRFSPEGAPLEVKITQAEEGVRFAVTDHGEGIPLESQAVIFAKFGQVHGRKSNRIATSGIGLSFCKMAVEAHEGQIGFESTHGEGSTFWFIIPSESKETVTSGA